jgi:hypothetical protein
MPPHGRPNGRLRPVSQGYSKCSLAPGSVGSNYITRAGLLPPASFAGTEPGAMRRQPPGATEVSRPPQSLATG